MGSRSLRERTVEQKRRSSTNEGQKRIIRPPGHAGRDSARALRFDGVVGGLQRRARSRGCNGRATGHLVRNTPKITGFVGGSRKPPALREVEVARMRTTQNAPAKQRINIDFNQGDQVRVTEGPFANFNGSIEEVKADKQKVKVLVSIFGRSTAVELDFNQVEKTG